MDANCERKRRLPVWLAQTSDAGRVKTSGNKETGQQPQPSQASKRKKKECKEDVLLQEEKPITSEGPKKTRRSSKNSVSLESSCSTSGETCIPKRSARRNTKLDVEKKDVKVKSNNCHQQFENAVSGDGIGDQIDLTVDDLRGIAQEILRVGAVKESTLESQKSMPSNSFHDLDQSFCQYRTTSASFSETEVCVDDKVIHGEENITTNITKTSNTAQNMLDLFLGPLLKQTDTSKTKSEMFTGDDLNLTSELGKEVVSEEEDHRKLVVPVEKKKSSLKDKVALFLC